MRSETDRVDKKSDKKNNKYNKKQFRTTDWIGYLRNYFNKSV